MAPLGGRENIVNALACATSRLRLELKNSDLVQEDKLQNLGVFKVIRIDDKVVHLLMGDRSVPTGQALNALI